jgi:hypothetical protein
MKPLNRGLVLVVAAAAVAGTAAACGGPGAAPAGPPVPEVPLSNTFTTSRPVAETAAESPALGRPVGGPTTTAAAARVESTDLVGTQYGYLTAVDSAARTVTFDKVEWFTGAAARKACRADGVRIGDGAMCNDYYIRNHNPKLRTAPIAPGARLSLQSPADSMVQLEVSLDDLDAVREDRLFIITFSGGKATRIRDQFLP